MPSPYFTDHLPKIVHEICSLQPGWHRQSSKTRVFWLPSRLAKAFQLLTQHGDQWLQVRA